MQSLMSLSASSELTDFCEVNSKRKLPIIKELLFLQSVKSLTGPNYEEHGQNNFLSLNMPRGS